LSCNVPGGSEKALWDVAPVASSTGQAMYVIKSRTNGRCLIRSGNGTAQSASLHLWATSGEMRFCGFPTADALIANGQAAWDLGDLHPVAETQRAYHAGAIRLNKPTQAFLGPATGAASTNFSNDAGVVEQWMLEFHPAIATPPEARNVRIEGQAMHGRSLKAAFDAFDAHNDPFGGTTYQWCWYPLTGETENGCTQWSTSDTWTVPASVIGMRLAVKVIPRTTSGTPNVGEEAISGKTAAVATWVATVYKNDTRLDIPDSGGGTVWSYLHVGDSGTITDQRVQIRLIHPHIGDLEVKLADQSGKQVTLHSKTGGGEDNLIREYTVAGLNTEQGGWWALSIRDTAKNNVGYLESWSMTFQAPP
jgi:hypothetical protein